jgi:putative ATP-dependent endonuclease of the OLD family
MEPFAQALGMSSEEFKPWRALFGSNSKNVLLVEGDTDKEYFELLRSKLHGEKALVFDGDILAYGGKGSLVNQAVVKFILSSLKRVFITFDLDARKDVEKCLTSLSLKENSDFIAIGLDQPGKRSIEGLLPESVRNIVNSKSDGLLMAATSGSRDESESARNRLKQLYLAEFKATATPGEDHYREFYKIVKVINRAFR